MILGLNGVGISFDGETILSNIDLKVEEGEKIGLIGVNGAGKSTLLKIITGELTQEKGEVIKARDKKYGYLKQDNMLNLENTIYKEMLDIFKYLMDIERQLRTLESDMTKPEIYNDSQKFERIMKNYSTKMDYFSLHGGYEIEAKINSVLDGIGFRGISKDTEIYKLSGGQKTKLSLAKILLEEPDLLMLDEPTNHLDFEALTWLEGYMKSYKGAALIVSHDRYLLDSLVTGIYEIERGTSKRYAGNYTKYMDTKAKNREILQKNYEEQQQEMKRLQTFIDKHIVRATSSKAAKNKRHILQRIENKKIDKPAQSLKRINMKFEVKEKSHKEVLIMRKADIIVGEGEERKTLIKNLGLDISRGEKIALVGPNGIGKTTLLKTLIGEIALEKGEILWGKNVHVGYYDQEHEKLNSSNTIIDEVWGDFPDLKESDIKRVLGNFLFTGEDTSKIIGDLSGGERARIALSKLMLKGANMLLLDEPTNHLDLYSKERLENVLEKFEGSILFVSHDRYFINKIANRVIALDRSGIKDFKGNYDYYAAHK